MPIDLSDLLIPVSPKEQQEQELMRASRKQERKNIFMKRILKREGIDTAKPPEKPTLLQTVFNALNTEIGTTVGALIAFTKGERDYKKLIDAGIKGWKEGRGVADLLRETDAIRKVARALPRPSNVSEQEWEDLLVSFEGEEGEGTRRFLESVSGLAVEIAIPPLAVQKGAKYLGKAGKYLLKTGQARKFATALKKTEPVQMFGRTFIHDFNLPEGFSDTKRMAKFWKANRSHDLIDEIGDMSKKFSEAERSEIGRAIVSGQKVGFSSREVQLAAEQSKRILADMLDIELKHGIKVGEIDNYLPRVYSQGKIGYAEDVSKALATRAKQHIYAVSNKMLIDDVLKNYGIRVGPDDFKIGGKYSSGGGKRLGKPSFAKARKLTEAEAKAFTPAKLPEGYKLYMPSGSLRFYKAEVFSKESITQFKEWADQLKQLETTRILKTTKTTSKGPAATSGPMKKLEQTVSDALQNRGFTEGEAGAYLHKLKSAGREGVDEIISDVTETIEQSTRIVSAGNVPLTEINPSIMVGVTKKVPTYLIPEAIANDLNKIVRTDVDELVKAWNKPLKLWQGYATFANPGFHLRNAYSNLWQAHLAGVSDYKRYSQSLGMITHQNLDGFIEGGKYTYGEVLELTKKWGIKSRGRMAAEIPLEVSIETAVARATEPLWKKIRYFNPAGQENVIFITGRKLGTSIENHARVTVFLDALVKGETPAKAAKRVRKYLFDYTELTDAEKKIFKNIMPFYTWMRKNIPLQVTELIKQPKKFADVGKLIRATEHLSEPIDKELLPEYYKELHAVHTPFKTDKGHPLFFNPNFPWQDLNKIDTEFMAKNLVSSLRPEAQIAYFAASGKLPFSGREIPDSLPAEAPSWTKLLPGPVKKVIGVEEKVHQGRKVTIMPMRMLVKLRMLMPFLRKAEHAFPTKAMEQDERLPTQIMSDLIGVKFMPFDEAKTKVYQPFKEKERLKNLSRNQRVLENLIIQMQQSELED